MTPSIWVHCLLKNEENYIWYALNSVVGWVDKILVWDAESTDRTPSIVKEAIKRYGDKITLREYGRLSPKTYSLARQEMINQTKADWIIILDGDEVWWEDSIKKLCGLINEKGEYYESIVVRTINLIGDVYHYQEEKAGKYELAGRKGHIALRAISTKIPGLKVLGDYGHEGYYDNQDRPIQERDRKKIFFLDTPYLHFTHLPRSSDLAKESQVPYRLKKIKHEIGICFPPDFYYPEALFRPRPKAVPFPWRPTSFKYNFRAFFETPLKRLRRKSFLKYANHGY